MSEVVRAELRFRTAEGRQVAVSLGPAGTVSAHVADGGAAVTLVVSGIPPGQGVWLRVGAHELQRTAEGDGTVQLRDADLLRATAGRVRFGAEIDDGPALELAVDVQPTRLAGQSLLVLLDELDALAPGLCADLGGHGTAALATSAPAEATLQALERALGPLEDAVALAARLPIRRTVEEVRAVAAVQGVASARDARWLATHPHLSIPARARGQEVTVRRTVHHDLHVPENQGVALLLARLEVLSSMLLHLVDDERRRIHAARPQREAFLTRRSNLFEERDRPRLRRLDRRAERIAAILGQVSAARARLAFPPTLRPAPFVRSPKVETHPGYWRLHQVWRDIAPLADLRPGPSLAPLRNTDELYELWCVLAVARTLADLARRPLGDLVGPSLLGWFAELPRGRLLEVDLRDWQLRLHYEPEIAYQPGADSSFAKLHPGRPWRPDLLLEVRAGGQLVEAHVFDAKHSLDPSRRGGVPQAHAEALWLKYPDSIGRPGSRLPVVSSCWVLYPGPVPWVDLRSPGMLDDDWPSARARGGAIALTPGLPETERRLRAVLEVLLRR